MLFVRNKHYLTKTKSIDIKRKTEKRKNIEGKKKRK